MASSNPCIEEYKEKTHEGATASRSSPLQQLRRSVLAYLLWEDTFYEDGKSISERISDLCKEVPVEAVVELAVEARTKQNLRHVPLLLLSCLSDLSKGSSVTADAIERVISRPDEIPELLAVHCARKKIPLDKVKSSLTHGLRSGLARAFNKFDSYSLAKYRGDDKTIKLRDALRLVHPKPKTPEQSVVYKSLIDGTLKSPDTWEVALSTGKDPKETWTRLIKEEKLGYFALLRNLRNMDKVGVADDIIQTAILARRRGADKILPFRFLTAAKASPKFERQLELSMFQSCQQLPKLEGKTIFVVDISGSMHSMLSSKSEVSRRDAANAITAVAREICTDARIYATAGNDRTRIHATGLVPSRHGIALMDAISGMTTTLGGGGIFLKQVMDFLLEKEKTADRIVVITDEQDCGIGHEDSPLKAKPFGDNNYVINVQANKNGISYGNGWSHIDGFSENVLRYIHESEQEAENV